MANLSRRDERRDERERDLKLTLTLPSAVQCGAARVAQCTTNASNVVHLYHKSEKFVPQSHAIYYINVPQSEGREKKVPH